MLLFLKSKIEYFCNQAELHATLPHCVSCQIVDANAWFKILFYEYCIVYIIIKVSSNAMSDMEMI